ncbi:MAG: 7-cyano-7-deazaguanine synthase QueC [Phycisphaeraceae bacterium]|nr:7-cyano-7-deazaguanine synthase QueC [Phycisphaeraceae bacterium]
MTDLSSTSSQRRAVVLLSGGLDSAVTLAVAQAQGLTCHAISFDYGQRHKVELDAARKIAAQLHAADHRIIPLDLRLIGGSALTADIDVPKVRTAPSGTAVGGQSGDSSSIPITYVPARNLVFLSIALGLAEVVGARDIFIGANAVDYSGYPDCRPAFIDSFERTANLATKDGVEGRPFRVRAPLIDLTKADIIRRGTELGVDLSLTTSCYDPDPRGFSCGSCDSCRIRIKGFADANIPDPTRYATPHT